jgi:hypothetical protein
MRRGYGVSRSGMGVSRAGMGIRRAGMGKRRKRRGGASLRDQAAMAQVGKLKSIVTAAKKGPNTPSKRSRVLASLKNWASKAHSFAKRKGVYSTGAKLGYNLGSSYLANRGKTPTVGYSGSPTKSIGYKSSPLRLK